MLCYRIHYEKGAEENFLSTEQGLEIKLPPWVILVSLIKLDQAVTASQNH